MACEKEGLPLSVTNAVLGPSNEMPKGAQKVEELGFNKITSSGSIAVDDLISGMTNMGFQASSIGEAVHIINDMSGRYVVLSHIQGIAATAKFDIVEDIRKSNTIAVGAKRAGMIILEGGIVKHHIANVCLMRNGAENAVYVNTAQKFDGSDAGARPDEAVSWGKIKVGADSVKVYVEVTACFPLILAATFAKQAKNTGAQPAVNLSTN